MTELEGCCWDVPWKRIVNRDTTTINNTNVTSSTGELNIFFFEWEYFPRKLQRFLLLGA